LNDIVTVYPRDACVQELVERQVERTPDAEAVVDGHTRATYRELNTRANRLAEYLRTKGAAPETVVGLCVERSVESGRGPVGDPEVRRRLSAARFGAPPTSGCGSW
jgi:non-ribosomal peptide synthetase component F